MAIFYCVATGGFYLPGMQPDGLDCVEISAAEHLALREEQAIGKLIQADSAGRPVAVEPPPPPPKTREEIEAIRLRAYGDPITGSDRYFAEAQRESLVGNAEAAEAAKALGMARFAAIQAEYPWPAE